MISVPEKSIRFGVRTSTGHKAATWKVWAPSETKHDVYLACRSLKGELKASLHQSGNWHVAFSKKFYDNGFVDEVNRPESRFIDRWLCPQEIAQGVTLAFRVVVPCFSATREDVEAEEDVIWVPSAPEKHAIQFAIVLTSPTCVVSDWPGKRSMNTQLVGSFILSSKETVWVVYSTVPFQPSMPKTGKACFFKGVDPAVFNSPTLRAVFFGEEPDGSRVMYDFPICIEDRDG